MRRLATQSCLGRAVQLGYGDENGRLKLDPEAIDALQRLKGPVAVVSLYGRRACHDKSFLWNQFLRRSLGYQFGSVHQPRTGDLWMWIEPTKRIGEDGTEYNLVLLDLEGAAIDGPQETINTQMFSLGVLLSSLFIYVPTGNENAVTLDNLPLVVDITKHVHDRGAPMFLRLLMSLNPEKVKDNSRVAHSDSLNSASKQDASVRESLQALLPDPELVTLTCPMINEAERQCLDQNSLEELQPQFRCSIDAVFKFVFERTRPKNIVDTTVTGPLLAGFTKAFLESLNKNLAPEISSSWQSVVELECRKAYDTATDLYMSSLEPLKTSEELSLMEAHNKAVLKAMSSFNTSTLGIGETRQKFETDLCRFFRKAFEDHRKVLSMEEDSTCCNAVEAMGKKLQLVYRSRDAHMDDVVKALDTLVAEYEVSVHGPRKWQKLSSFLRKSLQEILVHREQNHVSELLTENSSLRSQHCSMENTINSLKKQLEGGENQKNEYQKRYKDAIEDMEKISDQYKSRLHDLESRCRSVKEENSNLMEKLEFTRQEALEWKQKFEDGADDKTSNRSRGSEATCNDYIDWKIKYENSVSEAKAASEKINSLEERLKEVSAREDAIKAQFSRVVDDKEKRINDTIAELTSSKEQLTALCLELKNAEMKAEQYSMESTELKRQVRVLEEEHEAGKFRAERFEAEMQVLKQEKADVEKKYLSCLTELEKISIRLEITEGEAATVRELVNSLRLEKDESKKKEDEFERLLREKCVETEEAKRWIEDLGRQKMELAASMETQMKEKEEEIAVLQRIVNDVNNSRVNLDVEEETPYVKRLKVEETTVTYSGSGFGKETENREEDTASGKGNMVITPRRCTSVGCSASTDHSKYTMKTLRSEIVKHGFEDELTQLKNPRKRDLVELYERCVLHK